MYAIVGVLLDGARLTQKYNSLLLHRNGSTGWYKLLVVEYNISCVPLFVTVFPCLDMHHPHELEGVTQEI